MRDPQEAVITKNENTKDFTRITFVPDLKRFHLENLDDDHVALFKRRAYDVAVSAGCKVSLNGKRIPVSDISPGYLSFYSTMFIDNLGKEHERLHADVCRVR